MIKAIEVPDEYEEKPRILALLCENDALPALDAAGRRRRDSGTRGCGSSRCAASARSTSSGSPTRCRAGIDGVILIGCKSGDDYQCHFVRGCELANTRLDNVQETLERLALEPERVKVVELAHDEFDRIPEILDEFAEEIEEIGPNPFKGF